MRVIKLTFSFDFQAKLDEDDDNKLEELVGRLEVLSKENEALKLANEESRRIFDESLSREVNKNSALSLEMMRLKEYSEELSVALEKEKQVKDKTLFRNAEVSQLVQLTEQELKHQQIQNEELFKKIAYLEEQLDITQQVSQGVSARIAVMVPSSIFLLNALLIFEANIKIHIGKTPPVRRKMKIIIRPRLVVDGFSTYSVDVS